MRNVVEDVEPRDALLGEALTLLVGEAVVAVAHQLGAIGGEEVGDGRGPVGDLVQLPGRGQARDAGMPADDGKAEPVVIVDDGQALVAGTGDALRTWRQP